MSSTRTSLYLPSDLVERVKKEAAVSCRSFSGQVAFFLRISVAQQAQQAQQDARSVKGGSDAS